jgi:hypothetical protein
LIPDRAIEIDAVVRLGVAAFKAELLAGLPPTDARTDNPRMALRSLKLRHMPELANVRMVSRGIRLSVLFREFMN